MCWMGVISATRSLRYWVLSVTLPRSLRVYGVGASTVIRPVMIYGAETCVLKLTAKRKLERVDMRMLRQLRGVRLRDLGNKDVRRGGMYDRFYKAETRAL